MDFQAHGLLVIPFGHTTHLNFRVAFDWVTTLNDMVLFKAVHMPVIWHIQVLEPGNEKVFCIIKIPGFFLVCMIDHLFSFYATLLLLIWKQQLQSFFPHSCITHSSAIAPHQSDTVKTVMGCNNNPEISELSYNTLNNNFKSIFNNAYNIAKMTHNMKSIS